MVGAKKRNGKTLILLTGLPGSGKSTFAKQFACAGTKVLNMGDTIREEAARRGIGKDIHSTTSLMFQLRRQYGEDYVARATAKRIDEIQDKVIVVDGIRSPIEVDFFKKEYGNILLVALVSTPEERFARLKIRNRSDDPRTIQELAERDNAELNVGMLVAMNGADLIIANDLTEDKLFVKATEILQKIKFP
jgi:dephospho-CoA kinase